jgi:biopolymer transport protein ExbD
MANINETGQEYSRYPSASAGRIKKHSLKTDMTPMVDLGFLLISFFVITTEMSQPKVTHLNMPKDGEVTKLGESNALTVLLGSDNNIFYYHGDWEKAAASDKIYQSNFSVAHGLGKIIREKQEQLDISPVNGQGREGMMLLIKPSDEASYNNVIDMLDEALINDVKRYAVVKITSEEKGYMERRDGEGMQ